MVVKECILLRKLYSLESPSKMDVCFGRHDNVYKEEVHGALNVERAMCRLAATQSSVARTASLRCSYCQIVEICRVYGKQAHVPKRVGVLCHFCHVVWCEPVCCWDRPALHKFGHASRWQYLMRQCGRRMCDVMMQMT